MLKTSSQRTYHVKNEYLSFKEKFEQYWDESKRFSLTNGNQKNIAIDEELFFLKKEKKNNEIKLQILEEHQNNQGTKDYQAKVEKEKKKYRIMINSWINYLHLLRIEIHFNRKWKIMNFRM